MVAVAVVASLACAGVAGAATPALLGVGEQNRHATANFSMPGADDATIYFATRPDRATDGRFLEENVEHSDFLTTDEIQAGRWLDSGQLDPGRYYVMLRATDYECFGSPACMEGFSNMLTLTVPKPAPRYRASVRVYRYLSTVDLRFRVAPLGERLRYGSAGRAWPSPAGVFAGRSAAIRGTARPTIRSASASAGCRSGQPSPGTWTAAGSPPSGCASRARSIASSPSSAGPISVRPGEQNRSRCPGCGCDRASAGQWREQGPGRPDR
jgi:hypothetical protein